MDTQDRIDDVLELIEQKDEEIRIAILANPKEGCTWEAMLFAKKVCSEMQKLQRQKQDLVNELQQLQRKQRGNR